MIVPTGRTFQLAAIPLLVALAGQGARASTSISVFLFAAVLAAFVWDGWMGAARARLELRRDAPSQLHVDQAHRVEWIVENLASRQVTLAIWDDVPQRAKAEPRYLFAEVASQSRVRLGYQLVPQERGDFAFGDAVIRIRGPLKLAWRQKTLKAAQPVRCLPHLANWKTAELAERRALMRQSGSHRYRWHGSGTLFESLREYSPQDDIRWVDWKATSRVQRPITRNFESERHQQVVVLVDASRMMTTYCGSRTKFDAVLEAAVLVARAAVDQGDSLGLTVFSDQVDSYLHPSRRRAQVTAVMEILYARQPRLVEPNFEAALTLSARRNRRRTLFILFTDLTVIEAAQRMMAYVRRITPRHLPLIVTIADETVRRWELTEPRTPDELYQVGVANELTLQRARLLAQLRQSGATVLDVPADQIAARTIDCYLQLKRRARL